MPADAVPGSTIPEDSEAEILLRDGSWVWAQVIGQRKDRRGRWCVGLRWYASPTVGGREGWYLYDPRLIRRPPLTRCAVSAVRRQRGAPSARRGPAQSPSVPRPPVVPGPAVPGRLGTGCPEPGSAVLGCPGTGWRVTRAAVLIATELIATGAVAGQSRPREIREIASRGVPGLLLEQMPGPELLDQPVKDRPHRATLPPSPREIQVMNDLGEPG